MEVLKGSTIEGVASSQASTFDIAIVNKQLEDMQRDVSILVARTPRRVVVDAVDNAIVIVTFQDVGTTNYQVDAAWLTPNMDYTNLQWSIVSGSKTSSQVTLRIDGLAAAYQLEVTITPL